MKPGMEEMDMRRFVLSCVALVALACAAQTWKAPAALAAVETEPLYCFHGAGSGEILYKAGAGAPTLAGGPWISQGVVAHFPVRGGEAKPVYLLTAAGSKGVSLRYTTRAQAVASGWTNSGVVFNVAPDPAPDAVPFYRLRFPKIANAPTEMYAIGDQAKARLMGGAGEVDAVLGYVWLEPPRPKIVIKKDTSGRFPPPSIAVTNIQPAPGDPGGGGHTRYSIEVTNWQNYPVDFYQSTKNVLPPHPCGGDARGVVTTWLAQEGKPPSKKGCKGVSFVEDLRTLGVTVAGTLADTDKVYVTLDDRLTGERYESGAYMVGWFGVGKLLFPVGCKHFLGRAGQFLCSSEQGMAACENLKKQGKPIQCTRQGQPAK